MPAGGGIVMSAATNRASVSTSTASATQQPASVSMLDAYRPPAPQDDRQDVVAPVYYPAKREVQKEQPTSLGFTR